MVIMTPAKAPDSPFLNLPVQEENIDLEELEQFAKTFKRRRIELGNQNVFNDIPHSGIQFNII